MPVLELGRGADLQVNPRVVEDERKKRHETHGDDFVPGTGCNLAISLKLLSYPCHMLILDGNGLHIQFNRFCKVGKNRDTVSIEPGSEPVFGSTSVSKDTFASVACVASVDLITNDT